MVEPSSSSSTKQTVGWIILSSCATLGLYYLRQRRTKEVEDGSKDEYFDSTSIILNTSGSIDHAAAIAKGISRLKELGNDDYLLIRDEASVYEHQVAGHTDESKLLNSFTTIHL
jgi:hypothetical protein